MKWFYLLPAIMLSFVFSELKASHLVGGELTYQCLGFGQYEIKLTIYRDCESGIPYFDGVARVGVFNNADSQMLLLTIPFSGIDDTLEVSLSSCNTAPANVCVHRTVYTATIILSYLEGGYHLRHQRCCRNNDITNIVNPGNTGTTYYAHITGAGLAACNSSATFNQFPPPIICLNEPIDFDHSATDINGDSVVYKLCEPIIGASPTNPAPFWPFPPFYTSVTWESGYGLNNLLHPVLPNSLVIDSSTGQLTGLPSIPGRFVVSVCVSEYKNGVLMGTIQRDFQYNVFSCGPPPQAAFEVPIGFCDPELSITFNNTSTGQTSPGSSYFWDFGVVDDEAAISSLKNPTFTFPDTGTYLVTLITEVNTVCADTFQAEISVYLPSVIADFSFNYNNCSEPIELFATDLSFDTLTGINSQMWVLYNELSGSMDTLFGENPVFLKESGDYILSLLVTSDHGCSDLLSKTVKMDIVAAFPPDHFCMIKGDTAKLQLTVDDATQVIWSPQELLFGNNPNSPLISPDSTTIFNFSVITSSGDTCFLDTFLTVFVEEPFEIANIDPVNYLCSTEAIASITISVDGADVSWYLPGQEEPAFTGLAFGPVEYSNSLTTYLHYTTPNGCIFSDTFHFIHLMHELPDPPQLCIFEGDTTQLSFSFDAPVDYDLFWTPNEALPGSDPSAPLVSPAMTTNYLPNLIFESGDTCQAETYLTVQVDPPFTISGFLPEINRCDSVAELQVQVAEVFQQAGWYNLQNDSAYNAGLQFGPTTFTDSLQALFEVVSLNGCVFLDSIFFYNQSFAIILGDGVSACKGEEIGVSVSGLPDPISSIEWNMPGNLIDSAGMHWYVIVVNQDIELSVQATNQYNCIATANTIINVFTDLPTVNLSADPPNIFEGQSTTLIGNVPTNTEFSWVPQSSVSNPFSLINDVNPEETTTYILQVIDSRGCVNFDTLTVIVKPVLCNDPQIFIPTGFTPNNDGYNDEWKIEAPASDDLYAVVYDRWGRMVFETKSADIGWDGRFRGELLPPDVYAFRVEVKCINGEWYFYQGNVTLIR